MAFTMRIRSAALAQLQVRHVVLAVASILTTTPYGVCTTVREQSTTVLQGKVKQRLAQPESNLQGPKGAQRTLLDDQHIHQRVLAQVLLALGNASTCG